MPVFIYAFNKRGLSSRVGSSAIRFNTASTWGFPVLIKKSAIITPRIVVTGVGAKRVTAEIEAVGLGEMAGATNETGVIGVGLKYPGL